MPLLFSRSVRVVALIGLPALGPGGALALDPARRLADYSLTAWGSGEGLPQDTVQDLVRTRDGYLWVATVEGLARFDGLRFAVFDRANTPALRHNDVQALFESKDGALWIGLYGGGLVRYQGGSFRSGAEQPELATATVTAITEDAAGSLWVATDGRGLYRLRAGVAIAFTTREGLAENSVWVLHADGTGGLWAGTPAGLHRLDGERFRRIVTAEGKSPSVTALGEDGAGRLLVGTPHGLYVLEGGVLVRDPAFARVSVEYVNALHSDRQRTLWIGTDQGLRRLQGGELDSLAAGDGLTDSNVTAIIEEPAGSLWVGTQDGGLNHVKEGRAVSYGRAHGLSSVRLQSVAPARDGGLWIGSGDGDIDRYLDGRFIPLGSRKALGTNVIRALHEDASRRLWVGTDRGLYRFERGRWSHYTTREGLPADVVRAILEDSEGRLWIGTDGGGMSSFSDGRFSSSTIHRGRPGDHVRAILEDRRGRLWFGTYGGLSVVADGRTASYTTQDGLSSDLVRCLHEDKDGTLWVGTYGGGLNRLAEGRVTAYTSRQGLTSDVIYQVLEDDSGNLWMSCNKGLFCVSKAELRELDSGRITKLVSRVYGRNDGMVSSDFNGGNPAGWRGEDGRLYFPSSQGLVALDPRASGRVAPDEPVLIEQALVDGEDRPLSGGIVLAPATRRFEFRYTRPDLLAPERIRFSYRLEGFDADWVDAGAERAAHFTRVPAGDYRFRVRAHDEDGTPRGEPASVAVRVQARWYRTWGFFATLAIAGIAATLAAHRLRVRYLVVRQRELTRRIEEALASVKVLRGLLPICSHCKKVRDDAGYWNQLDAYVAERSEAEFSHGICPDCARTHYPDAWRRVEARRARERGDPEVKAP